MDLLVRALRSVLRVEQGIEESVCPVTAPEDSVALGPALVRAASRHRVEQVLAPSSRALGLAPEIVEALQLGQRRAQFEAMALVADTVAIVDALTSAGVRHLVLKGAALAVQTTGSAVSRGPGDVDVLVAPESVADAVEALVDSGLWFDHAFCPPPGSPLFPAVQRTQMESVLWLGKREVDLHWRLDVPRAALNWSFAELMDGAQVVPLASTSVSTLSPLHASVFSAAHGARDAWSSLRALVDHVRLVRGEDLGVLRDRAGAAGAGRRMDLALALGDRLLGLPAPAASGISGVAAGRTWWWLLSGRSPKGRGGVVPSAQMLALNLGLQDSPGAGLQRASTLLWPVRDMAARALGDPGDRRPWLYAASAPYFLSRRSLQQLGALPDPRGSRRA